MQTVPDMVLLTFYIYMCGFIPTLVATKAIRKHLVGEYASSLVISENEIAGVVASIWFISVPIFIIIGILGMIALVGTGLLNIFWPND